MAELASTIQAAHIKRDPSPLHDANPSTAASEREPVSLLRSAGGSDEDDDDDIPVSVLKPTPRHARGAGSGKHAGARGDLPPHFPPMPDLRFEQSYLHSISAAESWWRIAWITVRDQMMMPLAQGVLYNLAICGWQHWNRNARIHGSGAGARLRRWWYGVNGWALPPVPASSDSRKGGAGTGNRGGSGSGVGVGVGGGCLERLKFALAVIERTWRRCRGPETTSTSAS